MFKTFKKKIHFSLYIERERGRGRETKKKKSVCQIRFKKKDKFLPYTEIFKQIKVINIKILHHSLHFTIHSAKKPFSKMEFAVLFSIVLIN